MKKLLLIFSSLLILSCSPEGLDNDINDEQPQTQEPQTPGNQSNFKLPLEINYRFNDLDINRDYTSQNLYTYDELNRITEIEINSKINGINFEKHNYKIVYNLDTNLAKGFEVLKYSYETGATTSQHLKLKYPESYQYELGTHYAYYNFVNNYNEIIDDNFIINESNKISLKENFSPSNCGPNLLPGINQSTVYGTETYIGHTLMGFDGQVIQQYPFMGIEIQSIDIQNLNPHKAAFVHAKFDYIFWLFFLEHQFFQYEITEDVYYFLYFDHKLNYYEGSYALPFRNETQSNIYLNDIYPIYKKFTAKQFYSNDPNRQTNYFEYNVTYN